MKSKVLFILLTALITSLIVLGVQGLFANRAPSLVPQVSAQNIVTGHYYQTIEDTFIITANSSGSEIYVYYFDANMGEKDNSAIKFITKTKAQ